MPAIDLLRSVTKTTARREDFSQFGFVRLKLGLKRFARHGCEIVTRLNAGSALCNDKNFFLTKVFVTILSKSFNTRDRPLFMLLRFEGGAKGILHASQIPVGEENNLKIRIYGEIGGLEWHQREPNTLLLKWPDRPVEILRTGMGYLGKAAASATRPPPAHPEGYLEAFANIYRNFANHLASALDKTTPDPVSLDYPGIEDGIRGMAFIEAVVASSQANARWTSLPA
jgi:predicted dehydrogenase